MPNAHNEWKLAPPFDLTYCAGYNGEHFMDVAGEGRAPRRTNLLAVAKEGGLSEVDARRTLDGMLDCLTPAALREEAQGLPLRTKTLTDLTRLLTTQRQTMAA